MTDTVEIPTPTIPKDLEAQIHTIQAFAQCHAVMHKASFPAQVFQAAMDCIGFLKQAHQTAVEKALEHPNAELVPELAEVLKKEKENGQT
jgi:hypothetical protein